MSGDWSVLADPGLGEDVRAALEKLTPDTRIGLSHGLLVPAGVIILMGARTRKTLVKSLDADGVSTARGRRFLWQNLRYVDHVSKITRVDGVTRNPVPQ